MTGSVAVLRRLREWQHLASNAEEVAALDHAIAAVAERDALVAENEMLRTAFDETDERGMVTWYSKWCEEKRSRDALVARLGELEERWRDPSWLPANEFAAGFALKCADDLARVVKENSDG